MWRKKSRVQWLKDRDCNSFDFHKIPSSRRRAIVIVSTMVSLREDSSVLEVKGVGTNAFKENFSVKTRCACGQLGCQFPMFGSIGDKFVGNSLFQGESSPRIDEC